MKEGRRLARPRRILQLCEAYLEFLSASSRAHRSSWRYSRPTCYLITTYMARPLPIEDVPIYTMTRAAHIVQVPVSTLRSWACGKERIFAPAGARLLSFSNLTEAFVLASMRRAHALPMQGVRKALKFVAKKYTTIIFSRTCRTLIGCATLGSNSGLCSQRTRTSAPITSRGVL